jgi:hypothetical protein
MLPSKSTKYNITIQRKKSTLHKVNSRVFQLTQHFSELLCESVNISLKQVVCTLTLKLPKSYVKVNIIQQHNPKKEINTTQSKSKERTNSEKKSKMSSNNSNKRKEEKKADNGSALKRLDLKKILEIKGYKEQGIVEKPEVDEWNYAWIVASSQNPPQDFNYDLNGQDFLFLLDDMKETLNYDTTQQKMLSVVTTKAKRMDVPFKTGLENAILDRNHL